MFGGNLDRSDSHVKTQMDADGLVWLSSPVQGRRKKNISFPSSQVRSIILSTFGTLAGCHSQLSTNKKAANVSNALHRNPTKPLGRFARVTVYDGSDSGNRAL